MKIVRYTSTWNPTEPAAIADSGGVPNLTRTAVRSKRLVRPEQPDVFPPSVAQVEAVYGWFDQPTVRALPKLKVRTSQNFGLGTPGPEAPEEISFPDGWQEQSAVVKRRYKVLARCTSALGTPGPEVQEISFPDGWFEQSAQIRRRLQVRSRVTIGLGTAGAAPSGFIDNTTIIMRHVLGSAS